MNEAIWTAIIVAVPTVLTSVAVPIVMAVITFKQKMADREAEWRRQDEIADKVKETATEVAQNVKDSATKVAKEAKSQRVQMDAKLDVIHGLVNGDITTAMQNELDGALREVELRKQLNAKGSNPVHAAGIALGEARIIELQAKLLHRRRDPPNDQKPVGRKGQVRRPNKAKGN